ncbi:hypothetical protein HDZ31DRAFT_64882 [Schizophyllum fasciatum]
MAPSSSARPSTTNTLSGDPAPSRSSGGQAPAPGSSGGDGAAAMASEPSPVFDESRLISFAHYDRLPLAFIPLLWSLPWFFRIVQRIQRALVAELPDPIETNVRLWSCNVGPSSSGEPPAVPFFPGYFVHHAMRPQSTIDVTAPAASSSLRHADGHLGPGDPFEHAQYYRADVPYAAFVLRSTPDLRANHPAYRRVMDDGVLVYNSPLQRYSITAVFATQLLALNGTVTEEIHRVRPFAHHWPSLADSCPSFPSDSDIRRLITPAPFAAYLDLLTHVQRGLRAKSAWAQAAGRLHLDQGFPTVDELRKCGPPDADPRYLGVWINTAPELEGLWLLIRGRVPVYVAEQSTSDDEVSVSLTALIHLLPTRSISELVADRAILQRSSEVPSRAPVEQPTPFNSFLTHPAALGWRSQPSMEHHVIDDPGYPYGWIQAPPVPPARSSRKWQVWAESFYFSDLATIPCFMSMSLARAKDLVEDPVVLYDEENSRKYFLASRPEHYGLVDVEIFGLPLPRWRHFIPEHPTDVDLDKLKPAKAGRWVYTAANPGQHHAGRVQTRPAFMPSPDAPRPPPPSSFIAPPAASSFIAPQAAGSGGAHHVPCAPSGRAAPPSPPARRPLFLAYPAPCWS